MLLPAWLRKQKRSEENWTHLPKSQHLCLLCCCFNELYELLAITIVHSGIVLQQPCLVSHCYPLHWFFLITTLFSVVLEQTSLKKTIHSLLPFSLEPNPLIVCLKDTNELFCYMSDQISVLKVVELSVTLMQEIILSFLVSHDIKIACSLLCHPNHLLLKDSAFEPLLSSIHTYLVSRL